MQVSPQLFLFQTEKNSIFKIQPKPQTLQLTVRLSVILAIFPSPYRPIDTTSWEEGVSSKSIPSSRVAFFGDNGKIM